MWFFLKLLWTVGEVPSWIISKVLLKLALYVVGWEVLSTLKYKMQILDHLFRCPPSSPPICWTAYIICSVLLSSCSLAVLQFVKVFPVLWKRGVECWCSPVLTLSSKKKKALTCWFSAWSTLRLHAGKQSGVGKLQKACWLDLGQLVGGRQ